MTELIKLVSFKKKKETVAVKTALTEPTFLILK
jgi:hypothetical protein